MLISGLIVIIFLLVMTVIILVLIKKNLKINKIIKIAIIMSLLISCIIFGAIQYSKRSTSFRFTNTTDLSGENINGVQLYDDIHSKDFIKKYGTNLKRLDNDLFDYYRLNNDLVIATNKNRQIIRITTDYNSANIKITTAFNQANTTLKTSKGINLENSIEDIIKAYGENYYMRIDASKGMVMGYVDKNKNSTLEFFYSQNKVTQIKYDISSMQ